MQKTITDIVKPRNHVFFGNHPGRVCRKTKATDNPKIVYVKFENNLKFKFILTT